MALSYSDIFGRRASGCVQDFFLPSLEWNQKRYADVLISCLEARPGSRWLEAGCGRRVLPDGLLDLERAAVGKAGEVVGLDADWRSLAAHRSVNARVSGTLNEIPFADNSFDLVGCNMVAEHLDEPRRSLAEMARVLRPGGVLLVHTPNLRNYMVFIKHAVEKLIPRRLLLGMIEASEGRAAADVFPTLYRMNSETKLRQLADDLRLETDTVEFLSGPRPFFNFFLPLAFVQILIMRALTIPALRKFQSTVLVVMRKPDVTEGRQVTRNVA